MALALECQKFTEFLGKPILENESPDRFDLLSRLAPGGAENFITEVFCWLLESTEFGERFLDNLLPASDSIKSEIADEANWSTQERFKINGIEMQPDMICRSADGKTGLVFEHKVAAGLSQGQLQKYRDIQSEENFRDFGIVLITANEKSLNQNADYHIFWEEIHEWISDWLLDVRDGELAFVIQNFLRLLQERGLGPMEKIEIDQLLNLPKVIDSAREARRTKSVVEQKLKILIDRIVGGQDWCKFAKHVPTDELPEELETERKSFTWGRYGFHLLGTKDETVWTPGVFVGVMDDNVDHGPPLRVDSNGMGAIACLIVSVHRDFWDEYEKSEEYTNLVKALQNRWPSNDTKDWQFYNEKKNRWHPIFVYKPLRSLFELAQTGEEQVNVFVDQVSEVVEIVFNLDEFQRFKDFLSTVRKT